MLFRSNSKNLGKPTRFHACTRLSLVSTSSSTSVVTYQLRLVSRLGACWPPPASGPFGLDRFGRGFHVCSLCLIVWPFSVPTPGHLLRPLLTSAPSRPALLQVALCSWITLLPVSSIRSGQLATALEVLGVPVEPIRVMSSSSCTARGADLPR